VLASLGAVGGRGRRRAKEMVCAANLKGWGQVLLAFAGDNHGYFFDRADAIDWCKTLASYYTKRKLLLCPEATATYAEGGVNPHMAWEAEEYYEIYIGSYTINLWIADVYGERYRHRPVAGGASNVPLMLDGQWRDMEPYPSDLPPMYEGDIWSPNINEMRRACVNRHGGVNVVFMDGSVRKIGLKHLWVQRWYRGWEEDLAQTGFPVWPEWMANFPEP